jgi:DNA-binding MarR family transcriptional regulator
MPESEHAARIAAAMDASTSVSLAMQRWLAPLWVELDLTMAQLKALMMLAAHQQRTVGQLAGALHIGKPAASALVDQLVQSRLARRQEDATDRRRTVVSLTPTAEDLVARLRQGRHAMLLRWLSAMDDADLAALARGLTALAAAMRADSAATTPADTPASASLTTGTGD